MPEHSGDYGKVYAEAVACAERYPVESHDPYNGWCRVAGIPLRAEDCPRCMASLSGSPKDPS